MFFHFLYVLFLFNYNGLLLLHRSWCGGGLHLSHWGSHHLRHRHLRHHWHSHLGHHRHLLHRVMALHWGWGVVELSSPIISSHSLRRVHVKPIKLCSQILSWLHSLHILRPKIVEVLLILEIALILVALID